MTLTTNDKAFLDTVAFSELGQALLDGSDNGYNVIVGSTPGHIHTFDSYTDHPRVLVHLSETLSSTAAGRYQILARIYDYYKGPLGLTDFSPESQDAIAMQMLKECHAIDNIENGKIRFALSQVKTRWASMPGSPYGQHTNSADALEAEFVKDGGTVSA